LRALARPKRASHALPREPCTPCPAEASTPRQDARPAPGTHHAPTPALLIYVRAAFAGCPRSTCGGRRRHRAPRHHARRHLPRLRHPHRRPCSPASAPRSWAPRSWAPRSLAGPSLVGSSLVGTSLVAAAPRSAVPRPESPRVNPGNRRVWAGIMCAAWPCRPGDHRSHACLGARTARQDPGSCAEDPAAMSCAIPAAFYYSCRYSESGMSGIAGIASYSSYSQYVRVQE
jgi:hypothetical protein